MRQGEKFSESECRSGIGPFVVMVERGRNPFRSGAHWRRKTMKFMIIVKASKDSEAGIWPEVIDKVFTAMADYHEELVKAGVLLDGSGLHPSSNGWRVNYQGGKKTVIDGPFAEAKELIAGYTLIQVKSREEAME